jgi:hypothetical protein
MPTVERDISIGEASDVSIGDLHRRTRCRVILEKKFSTALSQDAEVGVKWNVQRGWRVSQASTLGCLWVA